MIFDWLSFLKRRNIPFITEGKNVKHGHVNVACPLCGAADPSQHMGIDPKSGAWACWRNNSHRGRRPQRLIVALIGCTWDEAETLAKDETQTAEVGFDQLSRMATTLFTPKVTKRFELERVQGDESFKPLTSTVWEGRFWNYLIRRKFHEVEVPKVVDRYNLQCATWGEWRQRLIFPFYYEKKLIGWSGRAIGQAELRYKSFPSGEAVKNFVYNHDAALPGGPTLVIVEGPVDTIKTDFYGSQFGVTAVGLLGLSTTPRQLSLLANLARRFDKVISLLDEDALAQSLRLSEQLATHVSIGQLPEGISDPGELTYEEASNLLTSPLYL